jgi:hypothetical protein
MIWHDFKPRYISALILSEQKYKVFYSLLQLVGNQEFDRDKRPLSLPEARACPARASRRDQLQGVPSCSRLCVDLSNAQCNVMRDPVVEKVPDRQPASWSGKVLALGKQPRRIGKFSVMSIVTMTWSERGPLDLLSRYQSFIFKCSDAYPSSPQPALFTSLKVTYVDERLDAARTGA